MTEGLFSRDPAGERGGRRADSRLAKRYGQCGHESTLAQQALFLAFVLAAFVVFAAALLLPMLRDYSRLLAQERLLREQVARLDDKNDQLVLLAANISDDPPTSERLARIELGYQRPGETIMPVEPAASRHDAGRSAAFPRAADDIEHQIVPAHWPEWAHAAQRWAAPRGLIDPFLDRELQGIWMLLAGGLAVAAFALFAPRRRVGSASRRANRWRMNRL